MVYEANGVPTRGQVKQTYWIHLRPRQCQSEGPVGRPVDKGLNQVMFVEPTLLDMEVER